MANEIKINIRIQVPREFIGKPALVKKLVATVLGSDEVRNEVLVQIKENTLKHSAVINALKNSPIPLRACELARSVGTNMAYVGQIVKRFVEDGQVERITEDIGRGRYNPVFYVWKSNNAQMEIATSPDGLRKLILSKKGKKSEPKASANRTKKRNEESAFCQDFSHVIL